MEHCYKIEEIHESLVNGQRRQMVHQIGDYGIYDFWDDYSDFLTETYATIESRWTYFTDAVSSYHKITGR